MMSLAPVMLLTAASAHAATFFVLIPMTIFGEAACVMPNPSSVTRQCRKYCRASIRRDQPHTGRKWPAFVSQDTTLLNQTGAPVDILASFTEAFILFGGNLTIDGGSGGLVFGGIRMQQTGSASIINATNIGTLTLRGTTLSFATSTSGPLFKSGIITGTGIGKTATWISSSDRIRPPPASCKSAARLTIPTQVH